ncbi:hypothetical protein HPP92_017199 [Vanilla planifolia]|uniref:Uncharacterized protein n=1 Tax=Vanilla planifolia TaxID=51239 RepID=A0A835Q7K8_VANPL|nr:hypothetical protein HPP92_017199 [Vanilla planifolia]
MDPILRRCRCPLPYPSDHPSNHTGLLASLSRKQGHVQAIAASGDLLYTGSDAKNIRVWNKSPLIDLGGFKSRSGLVKCIVLLSDKVFTGHRDGRIRVWKRDPNDPHVHRRKGTLPRPKKCVLKTSSRHMDVVSCLALDTTHGILYSGSWDRTVKAWRIADSRCVATINAHGDAVNTVAVGFGGLVFSGSADGTVKAWQRVDGGNRHVEVGTMLRQESAVTAIAVADDDGVVYSGASDGWVRYWVRGRRLEWGGEMRGGRMAVLCLAVAGRMVACGSAEGTVRVWRRDGPAGRHVRVAVLKGHSGPVRCLAMEADMEDGGKWVVYSGSLDGSVKVWRVAERPDKDGSPLWLSPPGAAKKFAWD